MLTALGIFPFPALSAEALTFRDEYHAVIARCIARLEVRIASPGGAVDSDFEAFLAEISAIGGSGDIGVAAHVICSAQRDAKYWRRQLALCHIASYRDGQKYLADTRFDYPVRTGKRSLRILAQLPNELRAAMLFQTDVPWCSPEHSVRLFNDGLIALRIPGTPWRLPILPACVTDAAGGLTPEELTRLIDTRFEGGASFSERIVAGRTGLPRHEGQALADWHLKIGEDYLVCLDAISKEWATLEFVGACEIALSVGDWPRAMHALDKVWWGVVGCRKPAFVYAQCTRLIDMLDASGFRFTAAEMALGLAKELVGPEWVDIAAELRERAADRLAMAGLPAEDGLELDQTATAIREVMDRERPALRSGSMRFGNYVIQCEGMRDPYAGIEFLAASNQEWLLMARRHPTEGNPGVFEWVTSATALGASRTHVHPRSNAAMTEYETLQGLAALDVLWSGSGKAVASSWHGMPRPPRVLSGSRVW
ncbi:hypothetical protein PAQ31011_04482 [Pandoraea aquatica]|uniref:Uncharacterized protein n=1 Tax=Pandoraea aquatica TaxID=2508290 RepID=A0A5E4YEX3_9BURK|nr:hypothetical protein [Pandoraea aquatica]VVE47007.1 hypothetical protein PAQ31011_04482 [Pandoraea aquatica]